MTRVRLVLSALGHLAVLRASLFFVPPRRLALLLGADGPVRQRGGDPEPVVWAVGAAARRAPFLATCLTEALAAHIMLRERGIASRLHLGAARDELGEPAFHCWLSSGGRVIIGEAEASYAEFAPTP